MILWLDIAIIAAALYVCAALLLAVPDDALPQTLQIATIAYVTWSTGLGFMAAFGRSADPYPAVGLCAVAAAFAVNRKRERPYLLFCALLYGLTVIALFLRVGVLAGPAFTFASAMWIVLAIVKRRAESARRTNVNDSPTPRR